MTTTACNHVSIVRMRPSVSYRIHLGEKVLLVTSLNRTRARKLSTTMMLCFAVVSFSEGKIDHDQITGAGPGLTLGGVELSIADRFVSRISR